jgi:hypothetical protein
MSMLAQAYAGTGDAVFKQKLDYIIRSLAECQDALAAAARCDSADHRSGWPSTCGCPLGW